jgi:hypothetical protein
MLIIADRKKVDLKGEGVKIADGKSVFKAQIKCA